MVENVRFPRFKLKTVTWLVVRSGLRVLAVEPRPFPEGTMTTSSSKRVDLKYEISSPVLSLSLGTNKNYYSFSEKSVQVWLKKFMNNAWCFFVFKIMKTLFLVCVWITLVSEIFMIFDQKQV